MVLRPEASLKTVPVKQREEQLEILLLPGVRRGRHQKQVLGLAGQHPAQREAPRGLYLRIPRRVVGAHPVGLIDHGHVPVHRPQLVHEGVTARHLVHADNQVRMLLEYVSLSRIDHERRQHLEGQAELRVELVVPLIHQSSRGNDDGALAVRAQHHLFQVEARHDRLARARIVRQKEAQRHLREHVLVDGANLMGQRLDVGGGHRSHRIVERRVLDAQRLRGQHEVARIRVVGNLTFSGPNHLNASKILIRHDPGINGASALAENNFAGRLTDRTDREHLNDLTTNQARELHPRGDVAKAYWSHSHAPL